MSANNDKMLFLNHLRIHKLNKLKTLFLAWVTAVNVTAVLFWAWMPSQLVSKNDLVVIIMVNLLVFGGMTINSFIVGLKHHHDFIKPNQVYVTRIK